MNDFQNGKLKKILDLPTVDRPREKLIARGPAALSHSELLAILLGNGIHGKNALHLAGELLKQTGLKGFATLNFHALKKYPGIGTAQACRIVAALELGQRFFGQENAAIPTIEGPESAYRLTRDLAAHKKEHFIAIYLNAKNQVLKRETISIGSLFVNMVHPREVFSPALEVSAAAVVLAHNHPSGDPEPSPEDHALTRRLMEASKILGIDILDHLVIGQNSYISFQEKGFL